jgi:hypothetical protein
MKHISIAYKQLLLDPPTFNTTNIVITGVHANYRKHCWRQFSRISSGGFYLGSVHPLIPTNLSPGIILEWGAVSALTTSMRLGLLKEHYLTGYIWETLLIFFS